MFESVGYPLDVIASLKKKKKITNIMPFKKALGYWMSLIASENECLLIYVLNICFSSPMNCLGFAHFFHQKRLFSLR